MFQHRHLQVLITTYTSDMRLTNVSQMHVLAGDLYTCQLQLRDSPQDNAQEAPGELPVSFDQRRHVGCGNRPGSWMAVSFRLPAHTDRDLIATAWEHVLTRHGTLRSVFSHAGEAAELRLNAVGLSDPQWTALGSGLDQDQMPAVLREHFDTVCQPFAAPSHRLCVIEPSEDTRPQVIIGADHSHVDAWSLLVLIRDLSSCVEQLRRGLEPTGQLPQALDFAEHTAELEARDPAPAQVINRWREILQAGDGWMPTFPLPLGDLTTVVPEVVEVRDVVDQRELQLLESYAQAAGVRLIAVAVSVMTRLADQLAGQPLRTVFPVHSRYDPRWNDSVGWFITNSVLENDDDSPQASYEAVREAVKLGSHALGPIMAPYGGMPQSPGMFAMSWLDHRKLPLQVPDEAEPQHVSAVIETDGVMIWFVVNETGMHLRCRYPDTQQARSSMRTWLAGLVYGLRAPLVAGELR